MFYWRNKVTYILDALGVTDKHHIFIFGWTIPLSCVLNWSTFFVQLGGRFPTNTVRFNLIRSSAMFFTVFLCLTDRSSGVVSSVTSGRLRLTFFALVCPSSSAFCRALSLWISTLKINFHVFSITFSVVIAFF